MHAAMISYRYIYIYYIDIEADDKDECSYDFLQVF